jgi:hypothetical protein
MQGGRVRRARQGHRRNRDRRRQNGGQRGSRLLAGQFRCGRGNQQRIAAAAARRLRGFLVLGRLLLRRATATRLMGRLGRMHDRKPATPANRRGEQGAAKMHHDSSGPLHTSIIGAGNAFRQAYYERRNITIRARVRRRPGSTLGTDPPTWQGRCKKSRCEGLSQSRKMLSCMNLTQLILAERFIKMLSRRRRHPHSRDRKKRCST